MIDKLFRGVSVPKLFWAIFLSILMYIPLFYSTTVVPQRFSFWIITEFFATIHAISPLFTATLIFIGIFLHSLLIVFIGQKFLLLEHRTYLPMFLFLGVSLFYTGSPDFFGVLMSGTFVLLGINMIFQNTGYKVNILNMFNLGMLLLVAALFFWQVIFVIPIFWVMTFFVNSFNIRSLAVVILGFLVSSLLLLYGLIAFDKLEFFINTIHPLLVDYPSFISYPRSFQIAIMIIGLTLVIGFLSEFFALQRKKIIVRKYFQALNVLFLTSFVIAIFVPFVPLTFSYFGILSVIMGSTNLMLKVRMVRTRNFLFSLFVIGIILFWISRFNLLG